jgi:hypothetical protein
VARSWRKAGQERRREAEKIRREEGGRDWMTSGCMPGRGGEARERKEWRGGGKGGREDKAVKKGQGLR